MPKAISRAMLEALPKIELHRHLEGALRLTSLVEIAREYRLDVPADNVETLRPHVQVMPNSHYTHEVFLSKFATIRKFFCAPEVIQRMAREAVEDAAEENIRYMELRFTPKALAQAGNFPFDEVVEWVCEAVETAQKDCNVQVRLIVSFNRHESVEDGQRAIQAAFDYRHRGVVGIDLAGQEATHSAEPFRSMFLEAHQAGMPFTIHAGEWAGAENVRFALEALDSTRIGHGVRIFEDPQLVGMARERGVFFEVCPTSNYQSGVCGSLRLHPVRLMYAQGLNITLNTDDPLLCNITMADELQNAVNVFGFTYDDIRRLTLNAAHASFLPSQERATLIAAIQGAFDSVSA